MLYDLLVRLRKIKTTGREGGQVHYLYDCGARQTVLSLKFPFVEIFPASCVVCTASVASEASEE
jgi:hypothetical protein